MARPRGHRLGRKQWQRQSSRALLTIDGDRLRIRPIGAVVVGRPWGLRPGAMVFVETVAQRVLPFRLLDRTDGFVEALRDAGVATIEELRRRE
ncbi:hypothetical protein ACIBH1_37385 [Nonomuraea sp. NPDC050663]|uniref:hypothetical protein n=1 Tax=Nonomuraea sp. NPDC050663 TaxID=3364370 RepID=UPI0037AD5E8B